MNQSRKHFSSYLDFDGRSFQNKSSIKIFCTSWKLSSESLMQEANPVLMEKGEFEIRNERKHFLKQSDYKDSYPTNIFGNFFNNLVCRKLEVFDWQLGWRTLVCSYGEKKRFWKARLISNNSSFCKIRNISFLMQAPRWMIFSENGAF